MNRAKILLLSIVMSVIVASCGTAPITTNCYVYDFYADFYGFNVTAGTWDFSTGLQTENGLLQFSYEYESFVSLLGVTFDVVKAPESWGNDFDVTANGVVYGVAAQFTAPFTEDIASIYIPNSNLGNAGKAINVTIDSGFDEIQLAAMTMHVASGDPFGRNDCAPPQDPTPLPETPTPTPTFTPTPYTETPTPPPTSTPSETSISYDARVELVPFSHACITPIHSFTRDGVELGDGVSYWSNRQADHTYNAAGYGNYSGGADINTLVSSLTLNIDGVIDMNSLTAGAFITSGSSGTNRFEFDFWYNDTLVYDATENQFSTGQRTETANYNGLVDKIRIKYVWRDTYEGLWINTFTINGDLYCGSPPATAVPTSTREMLPTVPPNTTATRTPIPFESPTPNITYVAQTATVLAETGTPEPTGTPTPRPSLTPIATFTPSGAGGTATQIAAEGTPDYLQGGSAVDFEILDSIDGQREWFGNVFGGIFSVFGDLFSFFEDIFGFIIGAIEAFFNLILSIINFVIELLEIAVLIIQLILGLINLLLAYMRALIERLALLIATFFTVQPTPIEAMPLCVTDPMSYDICAIYYIMDWTLFAPETPGTFIVPLLLAVMNVIIIMRFAKYVLRIVRRGEDVTR
jgi:hypothetical protein